jgi:two-component system phosphate regulon response regulator PhoB/two-component system alkaline phosphatase synthesis response regulator PhoP/two-component system response regulator VicR
MAIKGKILLVDDDRDIRDSLRIVLESNGYTVQAAANGREALSILEIQVPDLMLLDIMMTTDTEGFDLAFELKNQPKFENLPIIILTSFLGKVREDGPEQYQHILGEQWPAKWLFEKPVDTKKLLAKIQGILGGG